LMVLCNHRILDNPPFHFLRWASCTHLLVVLSRQCSVHKYPSLFWPSLDHIWHTLTFYPYCKYGQLRMM
jgi:hypothetical protein